MRNPLSSFAVLLTVVITLPFALRVSAQQTPPVSEATAPPVARETPAARPDPDQLMHIGGAVSAPVIISEVEPQFTEEAHRRGRMSVNVQIYLWVDENGNPTHVRAIRGVGMGLDEKAVEAVRKYKFKPAMLNGKPVTVDLYINVNFTIR